MNFMRAPVFLDVFGYVNTIVLIQFKHLFIYFLNVYDNGGVF